MGTYEKELHSSISDVIKSSPTRIAVIGAADGYYSVGLALTIPEARVIAFEAEAHAAAMNRMLAKRNCVSDRLEHRGICTVEEFEKLITTERPEFILMDIEGGELPLLTCVPAEEFDTVRMLIEIHDFGSGETSEPLREYFETTHQINEIKAKPRVSSDVASPSLRAIVTSFQKLGRDYLKERPPNMSWLDFIPKNVWPNRSD